MLATSESWNLHHRGVRGDVLPISRVAKYVATWHSLVVQYRENRDL